VSSGPLVCLSDDHDVEDSLEEQMEPIEAQGQAMARQMAQITHLVENALRIQPSPIPIPNDNRYASCLSNNGVLAEKRAQMAVDCKQQATDRRDETYRKHRMEKLPPFHDLEEWDI
jgi:hypothetical protein